MGEISTVESLAAIAAGVAAIAVIANASLVMEIGLKIWKKIRRAA